MTPANQEALATTLEAWASTLATLDPGAWIDPAVQPLLVARLESIASLTRAGAIHDAYVDLIDLLTAGGTAGTFHDQTFEWTVVGELFWVLATLAAHEGIMETHMPGQGGDSGSYTPVDVLEQSQWGMLFPDAVNGMLSFQYEVAAAWGNLQTAITTEDYAAAWAVLASPIFVEPKFAAFDTFPAWEDAIGILTNDLSLLALGLRGSIPPTSLDSYHFYIDTAMRFDTSEPTYTAFRFGFRVADYTEDTILTYYIDNQKPEFTPMFGADTLVSPGIHCHSLKQPVARAAPESTDLSTSFDRVGGDNWVGNAFLIPLALNPTHATDVDSLHVYLEIYDPDTGTTPKWVNNIQMAWYLQELSYDHPFFPQGGDPHAFWVDFTDGLWTTLKWMDAHSVDGSSVEILIPQGNDFYENPYTDYYYLALLEYLCDPALMCYGAGEYDWFDGDTSRKAEFLTVLDSIITSYRVSAYEEAIVCVRDILKPGLTGLLANNYEIPISTPEEAVLNTRSGVGDSPDTLQVDLASFPDGLARFRIEAVDYAGNLGVAWTSLFMMDKGSTGVQPVSPAVGELAIELVLGEEEWQSANLGFHVYFPDNDIANWTFHSYRVRAPIIFHDEAYSVECTQTIPTHSSSLDIWLSSSEMRDLFADGALLSGVMTWNITVVEFNGRETTFEWNCSITQTPDLSPPKIHSVDLMQADGSIVPVGEEPISLYITPTICVQATDVGIFHEGDTWQGIQYIEVWADIPPTLAPDKLWPTIFHLYESQDFRPELFGAIPGFIGTTSDMTYDRQRFTITPWNVAGFFNELPLGIHTLYLRLVDWSFNFVTTSVVVDITPAPFLNWIPGSEIYTTGGSGDLPCEIVTPGLDFTAAYYYLTARSLNEDGSQEMLAEVLDLDGSDGWGTTFSQVGSGSRYLYYSFLIGGSVEDPLYAIEPQATCVRDIPIWLEEILEVRGAVIPRYLYNDTWVVINDDFPHAITTDLVPGSMIYNHHEFHASWTGTSTTTTARVLVDGILTPYAIALDSASDNEASFRLDTYGIPDGTHTLEVEVIFANGKVNASDPVTIIVDNSVPAWTGPGVIVDGVSQWTSIVYSAGEIIVGISAEDPHTPIIGATIWLGTPTSPRMHMFRQITFASPVVDETFTLDLIAEGSAGITDGWYTIVVDVESAGGVVQGRPFDLCLDRVAPSGIFVHPEINPIEYRGATVDLAFQPVVPTTDESPLGLVEFFLQTAEFQSTESFMYLGIAQPRQDSVYGAIYAFQYIYDVPVAQPARFWARVTDAAGNIQLIPTDSWHTLQPDRITVDGGEVVLLTEGQPLTGSVTYGALDFETPDRYEASFAVYTPDMSDYITIGSTQAFYAPDGSFEITWDFAELPANLQGGVIPVSVTSGAGSAFTLGETNFARAGHFSDADHAQVLIVTGALNPTYHLFTQTPGSVYDWTYTPLDPVGDEAVGAITDVLVADWDGDLLQEICFLTIQGLYFLDCEAGLWTETEFSFSINGLTGISRAITIPGGVAACSATQVSFLDYIPENTFTPVSTITGPAGETIRDLALGTFTEPGRLVVLADREIYIQGLTEGWDLAFETAYALAPALAVADLAPGSSEEIVCGVVRTDGVDVVQIDWNSGADEWQAKLCSSFTHITHIADLAVGRLNTEGLARVFVSHEAGVDAISLDYAETPVETTLPVTTTFEGDGTTNIDGRLQQDNYDLSGFTTAAGQVVYPSSEISTTYSNTRSLQVGASGAGESGASALDLDESHTPASSTTLASAQANCYDTSEFHSYRYLNPLPGGYPGGIPGFMQSTLPSQVSYNTLGFSATTSQVSNGYFSQNSLDFDTTTDTLSIYSTAGSLGTISDYGTIKGDLTFDFNLPQPDSAAGFIVNTRPSVVVDTPEEPNQWDQSGDRSAVNLVNDNDWTTSICNNEYKTHEENEIEYQEQAVKYNCASLDQQSDHWTRAQNYEIKVKSIAVFVYHRHHHLDHGDRLDIEFGFESVNLGSIDSTYSTATGSIMFLAHYTDDPYDNIYDGGVYGEGEENLYDLTYYYTTSSIPSDWGLNTLNKPWVKFHAGDDGAGFSAADNNGYAIALCEFQIIYEIVEVKWIKIDVTAAGYNIPYNYFPIAGNPITGDYQFQLTVFPLDLSYDVIYISITTNHPSRIIDSMSFRGVGALRPGAPGWTGQNLVTLESDLSFPVSVPSSGHLTKLDFDLSFELELGKFGVFGGGMVDASGSRDSFYGACFENSLSVVNVKIWDGVSWATSNAEFTVDSNNWATAGAGTFHLTWGSEVPSELDELVIDGKLTLRVEVVLEIDVDTWLLSAGILQNHVTTFAGLEGWAPILTVGYATSPCTYEFVVPAAIENEETGIVDIVCEYDAPPASRVSSDNFQGTFTGQFVLDLSSTIYEGMNLVELIPDYFTRFPFKLEGYHSDDFFLVDICIKETGSQADPIVTGTGEVILDLAGLSVTELLIEFSFQSSNPSDFVTPLGGDKSHHFTFHYFIWFPGAGWLGVDPVEISIPFQAVEGSSAANCEFTFGSGPIGQHTQELTLVVDDSAFNPERLQKVLLSPHGSISHLCDEEGGFAGVVERFPADPLTWINDGDQPGVMSFSRIQGHPPLGGFENMGAALADSGVNGFPLQFVIDLSTAVPGTYYEIDAQNRVIFRFRFVVDQDFQLDSESTSILAIDFSGISIGLITLAPDDRTNAFVAHENTLKFGAWTESLEGGLEISTSFSLVIIPRTLDGVFLPVDDRLLWGTAPGCDLHLWGDDPDKFLDVGTFTTAWTSGLDGSHEVKGLSVTVKAYVYNVREILQEGDTIHGELLVRWAVLNNRLETVVLDISFGATSAMVTQISHPTTVNRVSSTPTGDLSPADLNADGDGDCLTSTGLALIPHSSVTAIPAKVTFTDSGALVNPISFDTDFLVTLDAGTPRPFFSDITSGETPVFRDTLDLEVVDFALDLTRVDLECSLEGPDGPWTPLASLEQGALNWPVDFTRNYFTFSIPTNQFVSDDFSGRIWVRATTTNGQLDTGVVNLEVLIDLKSPETSLELTPGLSHIDGQGVIASSQVVLTFTISYDPITDGPLDRLEVRTSGGVSSTLIFPVSILTQDPATGDFSLAIPLLDLVGTTPLASPTVTVSWCGRDIAGNVEDITSNGLVITIDLDGLITFFDPSGNALLAGTVVDLAYGQRLRGRVEDSFGRPLPPGTWVDVCLDGLTFLQTEVVDDAGTFVIDLQSHDLLSPDLRGLSGVAFSGIGGDVMLSESISHLSFLTLGADPVGMVRSTRADGLKRPVARPQADPLTLQYAGLDLGATVIGRTFEGIKFDLLVPYIWAATGGTFSAITIELIGSENTWTFTAPTEIILPLLEEGRPAHSWTDMQMATLPLTIPLTDFEFNQAPLDLAEVHTIRIVGTDNIIHPGIDFFVPTQAYQALACEGVYLVDGVNDWSLVQDIPVRTTPYADVAARVTLLGQPTTWTSANPLQVVRSPVEFNTGITGLPTSVQVDYQLSLAGIDLVGHTTVTSRLATEYLVIQGTIDQWNHPENGVGRIIGMNLRGGVHESADFWMLGQPLTYAGITLEYSGNGLFLPAATSLASSLIIEETPTTVMIWESVQGTHFQVSLPRESNETFLGARLLDAENVPLLPRDLTLLETEVSFQSWQDGKWAITDTCMIKHDEAVLFGVLGDDGLPVWVEPCDLTAGFFNLTIDNRVDGNLPMRPGFYTGIFHYLGTEYHAPVTRYFTFSIEPSAVLLQTHDPMDPKSPVWVTPSQSGEFIDTLTYSDSKTLEFRLLDTFDERPIVDAPVWLQVGVVPRQDFLNEHSPYWVLGDYLYHSGQVPPEELGYRSYKQSGTGIPVLYPFFNEVEESFGTWAPLYYAMAETDVNGTARFTLSGPAFEHVIEQYEHWLNVEGGVDLDDIELYLRAFYTPTFHAPSMRIPEGEFYGSNYPIDFGGNEEWVYEIGDDPYTPTSQYYDPTREVYLDPFRAASFFEGILEMHPEDTMIIGAYQELYGAEEFTLIAAVVEADVENGQYFQEAEGSPDNFIDTQGLEKDDPLHMDRFGITLQIYDMFDQNCLVEGEYRGNLPDGTPDFWDYISLADAEGVVEFKCSEEYFGPRWDRLVPGEYVARYDVYPDTTYSYSDHYVWPLNGSSRFMLKSDSTYCLDTPSHLYSLSYLLGADPSVEVNYADLVNPSLATSIAYETGLPTLTGEVLFMSTTPLPENYNLTDTVYVNISLGDMVHEIVECRFDPETSTTGPGSAFQLTIPFEVPFNHLEDLTPDVVVTASYVSNPLGDLGWISDLELELDETATLFSVFASEAWETYQPASTYLVQVRDLTVRESVLRDDGQIWELWRESPLDPVGDLTDPMYWTYQDGSIEDEVTIETPIVSVPADFENFVDTSVQAGYLQFKFDGSAVDQPFHESMDFIAQFTIPELLKIERKESDTTREVDHDLDPETDSVEEWVQFDEGFQLIHPGVPTNFDHALRSASYADGWTPKDVDALYAGLYQGDEVSFTIPRIYLPYMAELNWTLRLPMATGIGLEVAVDVVANDLNPWYKAWSFESADLSAPVGCTESYGYWWAEILEEVAPDLWSNFVNLTVTITLHTAPDPGLVLPLVLVGGYITGAENVIRVSTGYPRALRERLYSTNFVYLYSRYTQSGFGATQVGTDATIDDVYFKITDDNNAGPFEQALTSILDTWDWPTHYQSPELQAHYEALDEWVYNTELGTYNEFQELFKGNRGTFAEIPDDPTSESTWVRLKFDEGVLANLEDPVRYSGFVSLHDGIGDVNDDGNPDYATESLEGATRKLTVLVMPADWIQVPERTILSATESTRNIYTTNLGDRDITVAAREGETAGHELTATLSYALPAGPNDISIDDWNARVLRRDPTPYPKLGDSLEYNYTWDVNNYLTYASYITGDQAWDERSSVRDSDIVVNLKPTDSSLQFKMQINNLHDIPGILPWGSYPHLALPISVDDLSFISSVTMALYGAYTPSMPPIPIQTFTFDRETDQVALFEEIEATIGEVLLYGVEFTVNFDGVEIPETYFPNLTIHGIGLYQDRSVGSFTVQALRDDFSTFSQTYELYPSLLYSSVSPRTQVMNLDKDLTNRPAMELSSLSIITPNGNSPLGSEVLEVFDVAIGTIDPSLVIPSGFNISYYAYQFDVRQRGIQDLLFSTFGTSSPLPAWTASLPALVVSEPMVWTYTRNLDFDYDGVYDLGLRYYDGAGTGNFQDGIQDAIFWDLGADGGWDYIEKYDRSTKTVPVGDADLYDANEISCPCFMQTTYETVSYSIAEDLTGDGLLNEISTYSWQRHLDATPNFIEYTADETGTLVYQLDNSSETAWSSWMAAIDRRYDLDADGSFEYVTVKQDWFQNSPNAILEDERFESQVEYYDNGITEETTASNTLAQELTFLLAGADDDQIYAWENYGEASHNITGTFVVEENVPVLLDTRSGLGDIWFDPHGTVAWLDSDGDGYCETAFLFSEQSWEERIAVAVYLSREGLGQIHANHYEIERAGDILIPGHWLSSSYDYGDIFQMGYRDSVDAHMAALRRWDTYIMAGIDTVVSMGIVASSVAVGFLIGGPLGAIVAGVMLFGFYEAYYSYRRPEIESQIRKWLYDEEKPRSLEREAKDGETWTDTAAREWENFLTRYDPMKLFTRDLKVFHETAPFIDIGPYTRAVGGEDGGQATVDYTIPQYWAITADNYLYYLDPVVHLENIGFFEALTSDASRLKVLLSDLPEAEAMAIDWMIAHNEAYVDEADNLIFEKETYVEILRWKTLEHAALKRRLAHQYYYRPGPDYPTDPDAPAPFDAWTKAEETLITHHDMLDADFTQLTYSMGVEGQPGVTAGYIRGANFTHPALHEIDYLHSCLLSRYRTGYETASKYDTDVFWRHIWFQIIPAAFGVGAGILAKAAISGMSVMTALSGAKAATTGRAVAKFAWEVAEEVWVEQMVAGVALGLGAPPDLAEQLGEYGGGLSILKNVLDVWTQAKQEIKMFQLEQSAHVMALDPVTLGALANPASQAKRVSDAKRTAIQADKVTDDLAQVAHEGITQKQTGGDPAGTPRNIQADKEISVHFDLQGYHFTFEQFVNIRKTKWQLTLAARQVVREALAQYDGKGDIATLIFHELLEYHGRLGEQGRSVSILFQNQGDQSSLQVTPRYGTKYDAATDSMVRIPVGYWVTYTSSTGLPLDSAFYQVELSSDEAWVTVDDGTGIDSLRDVLSGFEIVRVIDPPSTNFWKKVPLKNHGYKIKSLPDTIRLSLPEGLEERLATRAREVLEKKFIPITEDFEQISSIGKHGPRMEVIAQWVENWRINHAEQVVNVLRLLKHTAGFDIRALDGPGADPTLVGFRVNQFLVTEFLEASGNPPTPYELRERVLARFGSNLEPRIIDRILVEFFKQPKVAEQVDAIWSAFGLATSLFPYLDQTSLQFKVYVEATRMLQRGEFPTGPDIFDQLLQDGALQASEEDLVRDYLHQFFLAIPKTNSKDYFGFEVFVGQAQSGVSGKWKSGQALPQSTDLYTVLSLLSDRMDNDILYGRTQADLWVLQDELKVDKATIDQAIRILQGTDFVSANTPGTAWKIPDLETRYKDACARVDNANEEFVRNIGKAYPHLLDFLEEMTRAYSGKEKAELVEIPPEVLQWARAFIKMVEAKVIPSQKALAQGAVDSFRNLAMNEKYRPEGLTDAQIQEAFDPSNGEAYPVPEEAQAAGVDMSSGTLPQTLTRLFRYKSSQARRLSSLLPEGDVELAGLDAPKSQHWIVELYSLFHAEFIQPHFPAEGANPFEIGCQRALLRDYQAKVTGHIGEYLDFVLFRNALYEASGGKAWIEVRLWDGVNLRGNPFKLYYKDATDNRWKVARHDEPVPIGEIAENGDGLYLRDVVGGCVLANHFPPDVISSLNEKKPTDRVSFFEYRWTDNQGKPHSRLILDFVEATILSPHLKGLEHLYHGARLIWDQINDPSFGEYIKGVPSGPDEGQFTVKIMGKDVNFNEFRSVFSGSYVREGSGSSRKETFLTTIRCLIEGYTGKYDDKGFPIPPLFGGLDNSLFFVDITIFDSQIFST